MTLRSSGSHRGQLPSPTRAEPAVVPRRDPSGAHLGRHRPSQCRPRLVRAPSSSLRGPLRGPLGTTPGASRRRKSPTFGAESPASVGEQGLDGREERPHGDAGAALGRVAPRRAGVVARAGDVDVRPRQAVGHELGQEQAAPPACRPSGRRWSSRNRRPASRDRAGARPEVASATSPHRRVARRTPRRPAGRRCPSRPRCGRRARPAARR